MRGPFIIIKLQQFCIHYCFQLYDLLSSGGSISVYKTLKANGENAQVSYLSSLHTWAIASKNVCLLARTISDIDSYTADRYHFAKLMAQAWFNNILPTLTPNQVTSLQSELDGRTLVGEYVGNQKYQHLVKYEKVTILFYAMADNYSQEICLPIHQTQEMLTRYGLDKVTVQKIGEFGTYDGLCDKLEEVYRTVAESSISSEEEGSVLYFTNSDTQVVLSMCKLKTLEYRVFRKLREKLRNWVAACKSGEGNQNGTVKMQQFMRETEQLCEGFNLPHDLGVYQEIGQLGYECICDGRRGAEFEKLLEERYIDFLSEVMKTSKTFSTQYIKDFFGSRVFEEQQWEEQKHEELPIVPKMVGRTVSVSPQSETAKTTKSKLVIVMPPFSLDTQELNKHLSQGYTFKQHYILETLSDEDIHICSSTALPIHLGYNLTHQAFEQSADRVLALKAKGELTHEYKLLGMAAKDRFSTINYIRCLTNNVRDSLTVVNDIETLARKIEGMLGKRVVASKPAVIVTETQPPMRRVVIINDKQGAGDIVKRQIVQQKIPLYIGLLVKDEGAVKKELQKSLQTVLKQLNCIYCLTYRR